MVVLVVVVGLAWLKIVGVYTRDNIDGMFGGDSNLPTEDKKELVRRRDVS